MARTRWWMCVLDSAEKIKSAVSGCGGKADVEAHCAYSFIYKLLIANKSINRRSSQSEIHQPCRYTNLK